VRANTGDRVLLHVLNAGATESYRLELPGHVFELAALDGNPVPTPTTVAALQLSPGERISAHVVINRSSRWRVHEAPDSTLFTPRCGAPEMAEPDARLAMVLTRHPAARSGFNHWSVNGMSFSAADPRPAFRVRAGKRYRLQVHNTSDETVPLHLQRHRLQTAGILRDVVTIGAQQRAEVDFLADGRGPALLHCTRQLHADFGLRALLDYT
jgi:FtsP/CotA-like multicopper oxidase with cupredoxin domain